MRKSNKQLMSQPFWTSLNLLMNMKELKATEKLALVGLKKQLISKLDDVREIFQNSNDLQRDELMNLDSEFNVTDKIRVDINLLSAENLDQLEGIINVGE